MIGQDEISRILALAQEACRADAVQVGLTTLETGLTRFANGIIHQNVSERNASLEIKAVLGKRIGFAETNILDEASIRETASTALEFARLAVENPDFVELPGPNDIVPAPALWDDNTANCAAETRGSLVGAVLAEAESKGVVAAGTLSTAGSEFSVLNSRGLQCYTRQTVAHLTVAGTAGTGNGWAEDHAPAIGDLKVPGAAREAVDKALAARDPEPIEPGAYPVVLLPCAVEDMLQTLGWMGMGALAVEEQRSWMTGRLGQKVTGANVSVWDDAGDQRGFVRPFDAEGVARRRVDLLREGVAVGPVYDSLTAHKKGLRSTGHASSALGNWGPMPASLVMAPGDASVEELLAAMGTGVLVTRFHYTNTIHPIETTFTGMTRDGTFWVHAGKVQKPIKNLRFTQSILEALSEVGAIGRDLHRFPHCLAPALFLKRFNFTSGTDF